MNAVKLIEDALDVAASLGYEVRHEWLGGLAGGGCELRGRKILFVDLALGPEDQLDQVVETLRRDPTLAGLPMSHQLRGLLSLRKSA